MGLIVYGGETQSANPQEVKVRKDNDFKLIFLVERNGNPEDMSKATIVSLNLISPSGIVSLSPVSIKDNIIYLDIDSTLNQVLGKYNLELNYTVPDIEFTGGVRHCAVDTYAYTIVGTSSESTRIDELAKTVDVATGFQGKAFTFAMYTSEQIAELKSPALEAAQAASVATQNALDATAGAITAKNAANTATQEANTATDHANAAATLAQEEAGKATVATQQAGAAASDAFQKAEAAAQAATIAGQAAIAADNTRQALSQAYAVELAYAEQKLLEVEQAKAHTIEATVASIAATAEATRQGNMAEDAAIRANDAGNTVVNQTGLFLDEQAAALEDRANLFFEDVQTTTIAPIEQAEEARANAEGDATKGRVKAENERVTAEGLRELAEIARANAEGDATKGRVKAENERVDAEILRNETFGQKMNDADDKIEEMDETLSTYDGRVTQVESDIVQLAGDVALKEATSNKQNSMIPDGTGEKFPTVDAVNTGLSTKQAALVSGTNIKTVNGISLLGSGDANSIVVDYTHEGNKEITISNYDGATGIFTSVGHGFINGGRINFKVHISVQYPLSVCPEGTNLETSYYIVNATADTFQLSLTSGGDPLAMANTTVDLSKIKIEEFIYVLDINLGETLSKYSVLTFGRGISQTATDPDAVASAWRSCNSVTEYAVPTSRSTAYGYYKEEIEIKNGLFIRNTNGQVWRASSKTANTLIEITNRLVIKEVAAVTSKVRIYTPKNGQTVRIYRI